MTTVKIINLAPHSIVVYGCTPPIGDPPGTWTLEPSGTLARAIEKVSPAPSLSGIPLTEVSYIGYSGVPDPENGVYYVVSSLAAQAAYMHGRSYADLLVPGQQIRDKKGRIVGCGSLRYWSPQ